MFPSPGILPDKEAKERLTLPHSENISAPPLLPLCVRSYVLLFTSSFSPFVTWESGHSFPFPNGSPVIMLVMVMRRRTDDGGRIWG